MYSVSLWFNTSKVLKKQPRNTDEPYNVRAMPTSDFFHICSSTATENRKQNQIIENRIDQAALSKVWFCMPLERKPWLEAYIGLNTNITEGLYTHHIRVIAQALSDRIKWGLDQVDSIHLQGFQIQAGHQYEISDLMSLSSHLQELLVGIRSLKMTNSDSALELLSQWDLNIDQLDMCDMMIEHPMDPKIERRNALQRRSRRMKSLLLKAVDMSILCDAEIVLGIRIRETGRVTTFCSDPEGLWSPDTLKLKNYYPIPVNMTLDDFPHGQGRKQEQKLEEINDEVGGEE
ncbi:hypothetical protein UA08_09461 [Talaromyces atroroseus]|uniref:MADS-box domain-containing protein n=1 Tax=Talaromyces atroroseus TaxID=1441469 RepID=A0A225A6P0_TALAT|nr:hypothetical protein UA08_09461 [Talaromyces atroroseus]OKL55300.1 hypothetical protein UA08_09461 [Talaromyces atroroseus]